MVQSEVVYSDVKFTRRAEKADDSHQAATGGRSKVSAERAVLLALVVLLIAAVCGLTVSLFNQRRTEERLESLRAKWNAEKQNLTGQTCRRCESRWSLNGDSCYYFSALKKNWDGSKKLCEIKRGSLVKIDSRNEQEFLERKLRDEMTEDEDKFWIGLTDSETEGRWFWTDGSALDESLAFWMSGEPDDWKGKTRKQAAGEDCVRMGEKNGAPDLRCWFDMSCSEEHKFICEKDSTGGVPHTTCEPETKV
ncbi:unnamed protein product [Ophioblennius macclurei]